MATVGSVTGLVGAAGGLGGFVAPLIMGLAYGVEGSYAIGRMLLSEIRARRRRVHEPEDRGPRESAVADPLSKQGSDGAVADQS